MPTVPFDPSVDLSANPMGRFAAPEVAAPAIQQGPDYTGKQIEQAGAAAVRAGSAFLKIAERIQDEIDDAGTKTGDNEFAPKLREIKQNYLAKNGKDAIDGLQTELDKISEEQRNISTRLSDPKQGGSAMQQKMFDQISAKRIEMAKAEMSAHQLNSLGKWNLTEDKKRALNLIDDAAAAANLSANYTQLSNDASDYKTFKNQLNKTIESIAAREGIPTNSEQYKELSRTYTTALHTLVLQDAINEDRFDFAREYLKDNRKEISADKLVNIDKALDIGTFEAKTQKFAQDYWAQSKGNIQDALNLAREKLTGKEEDAVVTRIKMYEQERVAIKTQQKQELGNQAWSFILQNKPIPTTLQSRLITDNPEELRQIRDWIDTKRRQAKAEAEQGGNYGLDQYYSLRRMAMDDPSAFTGLDLRKFAPYMSKGQMEGLIDIQGSINKNDVKAMESNRVIKQTLGLIKSEVAAVGIDLTPKEGTPQAEKTKQFMGALTQALDQATKEKGKPLTDDEARRIGMSMLREGIEQGSGSLFGLFTNKKRGYEIATDQNIKPGANFIVSKYDDIPIKSREELVRDYVSKYPGRLKLGSNNKYILTDEAIAEMERAYTRGVEQGRFK